MSNIDPQALAEHLRQQLQNYEDLCQLEKEKNAALLNRNVGALEQITRTEQRLVGAAAELEAERKLLTGLTGEEPAAASVTPAVAELRKELAAAAKTLRELNETNEQLIRQEIRHIDYSLRVIAAGREKNRIYSAAGTGVTGADAGVKLCDQQV